MKFLILLSFLMLAYSQGSTAIGQPKGEHQQGQANEQVAASPSPTASVQPTIEKIETKPAGNETDHSHRITIVDERSPWPVWVANIISALVLLFLGFQTYVNRGMLNSMKKTEGFLEAQCGALAKQTDILDQSFRINSRAYVFISEANLKSEISSGNYPEAKIVVANSGKTPAYRYRMRLQHAFLSGEEDEKARKGIMPPLRPLGDQGHALGSGEFSTIRGPEPKQTWKSPEEREGAMRGLSTYHVWGLICYADVFNKNHAYEFSLYAENQNVTHLNWGRFGNDTEREDCETGAKSN